MYRLLEVPNTLYLALVDAIITGHEVRNTEVEVLTNPEETRPIT